jgi:hypothetical protein
MRLAGSRLDRRFDWAVSGIELQIGAHRWSWRGEVKDVVTEAEDLPGYVRREGADVLIAYGKEGPRRH